MEDDDERAVDVSSQMSYGQPAVWEQARGERSFGAGKTVRGSRRFRDLGLVRPGRRAGRAGPDAGPEAPARPVARLLPDEPSRSLDDTHRQPGPVQPLRLAAGPARSNLAAPGGALLRGPACGACPDDPGPDVSGSALLGLRDPGRRSRLVPRPRDRDEPRGFPAAGRAEHRLTGHRRDRPGRPRRLAAMCSANTGRCPHCRRPDPGPEGRRMSFWSCSTRCGPTA